mmetsp:Transcript_42591/g.134330  ORF Transcript_42591/g.134330 Transcript_42591/m.134330 type:complete len:614 (+) Transcript_42591:69-1910(+)
MPAVTRTSKCLVLAACFAAVLGDPAAGGGSDAACTSDSCRAAATDEEEAALLQLGGLGDHRRHTWPTDHRRFTWPTKPPPTPIAWCTSGGGFRAMTGGMAMARVFMNAGLLNNTKMYAIASNSGGSWFLSQLAYSDKFRNAVLTSGSNMTAVVTDWMNTYKTYLEKQLGPTVKVVQMLNCLQRSKYDNAVAALAAGAQHFYSTKSDLTLQTWDEFVGGLLDEYSPGVGGKPADVLAKWTNLPDMHFQLAFSPLSFLEVPAGDGSGSVLGTLGKNPSGQAVKAPQPLQWVVPGKGCPKEKKAFYDMPNSHDYFKNLPSTQAFPAGNPETNSESSPLFAGQIPSVSMIAGASSAYGGLILGSPYLMESFLKASMQMEAAVEGLPACLKENGLDAGFSCGKELTADQCATANGIVATGLAEAAPCGGSLVDGNCKYPNLRIVDGVFVDNLATAQTVGLLQKELKNSALRLVLTDWDGCTTPPNCDGPEYTQTLRLLFAANVTSENDMFPLLSPQVFEMQYDQLALQFKQMAYTDSVNSTLWYATVTTRTVDNKAFGVKAGTPVSLLIFKFPADIPTDLYMVDFEQGIDKLYPEMAQGIYDTVEKSGVVEDWLRETN